MADTPDPDEPEVDYNAGDAPEIYRLAYDISVRELESQEKTLDQVRVRTSGLLALAGASGAFLVGVFAKAPAADKGPLFWCVALAGACGLGVAVLVGFSVLNPRDWTFQSSATVVINDYWSRTLPETLRELAQHNEANAKKNEAPLKSLHQKLRVVMIAVVAELVLWGFLVGAVG